MEIVRPCFAQPGVRWCTPRARPPKALALKPSNQSPPQWLRLFPQHW